MTTQSMVILMLLASLAFAMVAESSLSSHFNDLTARRIGDTLFDDEEMMMPSESARRALADQDHITYRAMARNAIPCNQRGASYYHCNRMERVRPYRRGCTRITQCARRS
ncbi:unnamed protein product [Withania somnifera]